MVGLFEKSGNPRSDQPIRLVLKTVDLNGVLTDFWQRSLVAKQWDRETYLKRAFVDNLGELNRDLGWFVDLVQRKGVGGGFDVVKHVIQPPDEIMNVFSIQRQDECPMEKLDDLMDDEIAPMLKLDDPCNSGVNLIEFFDQLKELGRGVDDGLRCFFEPVKEPGFRREDLERCDSSPR